jgi:hypothetical protein
MLQQPMCSGDLGKLHRQDAEAKLLRSVAIELLELHGNVGTSAICPNWAAHREKRHGRFSGRHALAGMASWDGARKAGILATKLERTVIGL